LSLFRRPKRMLRGGGDPVALQARSVESRLRRRREREEAERARTTPPGVQAPLPDPDGGDEAGFGVREILLRLAPRASTPAPAPRYVWGPPPARDIRREGEQYWAEVAARARQRDAALTRRPIRRTRKWYDGDRSDQGFTQSPNTSRESWQS
jgi:hypothetical protein